MNYDANYLILKSEIEAQACPIHNIRPLAKIENGRIVLRCCCGMFTKKCMAEVDQKLSSDTLIKIVDAWQQEQLKHGLQVA